GPRACRAGVRLALARAPRGPAGPPPPSRPPGRARPRPTPSRPPPAPPRARRGTRAARGPRRTWAPPRGRAASALAARRGSGRAALPLRRRDARRPDRGHRTAPHERRPPGARRERRDRRAGVRRPAHALRRAALLGPVSHALRVARRHLGRDRQLRLRLRADEARAP